MNLQNRIEVLQRLKDFLLQNDEEWKEVKKSASLQNHWFTPAFIEKAVSNIVQQFLDETTLAKWAEQYAISTPAHRKNVGVVMAGNIPMVGFHDFLCVFMSGHQQTIKFSSKDNLLLNHLIKKMYQWDRRTEDYIQSAERIKGCDAYIATGSNNSSNYFSYYFKNYPHIIRKNRTSVAILSGHETEADLELLADDIHLFFGLGCRNVTKIFVPTDYDFLPLLEASKKYAYFSDHTQYKSNLDYYLTIQIMNNMFYMTNNHLLLVKNPSNFPPISQLNYDFYADKSELISGLSNSDEIQCIVGIDMPFGKAQCPDITAYADGVDTMSFLLKI